jgi:hypothetical protein
MRAAILAATVAASFGASAAVAAGPEVIGGPGAFLARVDSVGGFEAAIRRKLVLEIAGLPASVVPVVETVQLLQGRRPVDCLIGERSRGMR